MIPLAIAFTPNYVAQAATMLKSLLDASTGVFEVICLVTEEIPSHMKEKLDSLRAGRLVFRYIPLKGKLDGYYTDSRYTEAASFRLLLPDILPEYDSIIYIDCDVIVRQDIGKLYCETSLGDNMLGAVFEAPIERQIERNKALGCDPFRYFNSGFLLMNLTLMRKEKVTEKLLEACRVPYLEFPDQDALNQVCAGRVLPLSPLYNSIRTFFLPQYRENFDRQYPEPGLWERVQDEGTIHYTGGKPWNIFSVKFGEWWKVFFSLPRDIQIMLKASTGITILAAIYRLGMGKLIDSTLNAYRKVRYRFKR